MTTQANYRIYVASLSDYNNGYLHGVWIDCDGKGVDELGVELDNLLVTSKAPNVVVTRYVCQGCFEKQSPRQADMALDDRCPHCGANDWEQIQIPSAEEYAIHDHEGFPRDSIGEYSSLSEVADLVASLESCGNPEALEAFLAAFGGTLEDALKHWEDAYHGEFDSELDYTYQFIEGCGYLDDMPEHLQSYFDYEAFSRDLFLGDVVMEDGHVFSRNW